jgi:cell division protein FtsI/penicillin-binding protein 2
MWAGHGSIDLGRALAVSCNPYFEWVGEQLGYERVQRYAHLLGLGEPSGINLTGETAGFVPAFVRPERWDTSRATRKASRPPRCSSPC